MFEYSPKDIVFSWGSLIISNFHDGTMITAVRRANSSELHVGGHGDATVTLNPDQSGTVTANVLQGSLTNQSLMTIMATQERTRKLQKFPLALTDLLGSVIVSAPNAWLEKPADVQFDMGGPVARGWIWGCDRLLFAPGVPLR